MAPNDFRSPLLIAIGVPDGPELARRELDGPRALARFVLATAKRANRTRFQLALPFQTDHGEDSVPVLRRGYELVIIDATAATAEGYTSAFGAARATWNRCEALQNALDNLHGWLNDV